MFQISRSLRPYIQYFKLSSSTTSRILPRGNTPASKTLAQFRFTSIPYQNLPHQGLRALAVGSVFLLEENFQLDVSLDQMEQLGRHLGEEPLEKKEEETYETFQKRYARFLFKKVLEACEKQDKWILDKLDREVLNQLRDTNGNSLLIAAAKEAPKAIPWLVKKKIALDTTDASGDTALHIAASGGEKMVIDTLSFQIHKRNHDQKTPLHLAIEEGQVETVGLLFQYIDQPETCPLLGVDSSVLALAVYSGKRECYDYLAEGPCQKELSSPLPVHGSLLHIAIQSGHPFMLSYLLTKKEHLIHLDSQNNDRNTPLMLACKRGDWEAVGSLMEKGADPTLRGEEGKQASHLAAEAGLNTLKKLAGYLDLALLETKDHKGRRPEDFLDVNDRKAWDVHLQTLKNATRKTPDYTSHPPHYLAIQGGGPKGIAYLGAIEMLEERGLFTELKQVAGTSAGAILATLLAVGYTYEDLYKILMDFDIQKFLDATPENESSAKAAFRSAKTEEKGLVLQALLGEQIKDILHLKPKKLYHKLEKLKGLFEGDALLHWIDGLIEKKTEKKNCTFKELQTCIRENPAQFKHLHIYATQVTPQFSEAHFSSEGKECKDLVISSAVRASMSIPGVFKPHQLLYKSKEGETPYTKNQNEYVDGGLLNNFPLITFDSQQYKLSGDLTWGGKTNPRTLGLCLKETKSEHPEERRLDTSKDLGLAIASLYYQCETLKSFSNPEDEKRYIQIPVKLGLLDFDATNVQKEEAIQSGREATKKIFTNSSFRSQGIRTNLNEWALSPNFVGRVDTFHKITQEFRYKKLCVLFGLPGMGKTQAAYQYARQYQPKYSQIWVVNCKSEAEKHASYREIAEELGLGFLLETNNDELIEKRVHERLEENTSKPWLLILDNVIEKPKIPQKGGKILVTTNQPGVWSENQLLIESLSPDEAYQLLEEVTKETRSHEMEVLAKELGYFPLALTLAANCIKETSTIAEFLKDFDPVTTHLSKDEYYEHTIQTVWKKMLTTIQKKEPLALQWLEVCSYLDPAHIPASWIGEWLEEKGEPVSKAIEIQQTLTSFAIFKKTEDREYLMHPLLQKVVRSNSSSHTQEVALSLIQKNVDRFDEDNAETWNCGRQASLHLSWLIREKFLSPLLFESHFSLISAAGLSAFWLGNFNHADEMLSLALNLARNEHGETPHSDVASSLNVLGVLWHKKGDLTKAQDYYEKALAMKKQLYGETVHSDVATSLNNLGALWRDKGDLTKALGYHEKALAMRQQLYGETPHPEVAISLNNLGALWRDKGDLTKARGYYEKALAMRQQLHGETPHPAVATSLNNLGALWRDKGDLTKALGYCEKALAMRQQLYGETPHPEVATSLNNLGALWRDKGDLTKARGYYEKALAMRQQLHGETPHPAVATSLNNLGLLWNDKGDLTKAQDYLQQSYEMCKKVYGEEHSQTKMVKEHLNELKNSNCIIL